jgi:hypothetical protein
MAELTAGGHKLALDLRQSAALLIPVNNPLFHAGRG